MSYHLPAILLLCLCCYSKVYCSPVCGNVKEGFDCRIPKMEVKECLCRCLDAKLTREYINISFTPCAKLVQNCSYHMWFDVIVHNDKNELIFSKRNIRIGSENKYSQDFPLYKLTDDFKLEPETRYKVYIKPKTTVTTDSCKYKSLVCDPLLPQPTTTTPPEQKSELVIACFVMGIIIIAVLTTAFIFIKKRQQHLFWT